MQREGRNPPNVETISPSSSLSLDTRARRFPRVPFHTPVRVTRLSTGQTLELMAQNLSETGMFVETVIPFPVGELFKLTFPDSPEDFGEVAVARVVWRRAFTPSRPAGMPPGIGVAFLLMRPGDRRALTGLVDAGGVQPPAPAKEDAPRPARSAPPPPRALPMLPAGVGPASDEVIDLGPSGWLLLAALSMAAVAALLAGLQPLP